MSIQTGEKILGIPCLLAQALRRFLQSPIDIAAVPNSFKHTSIDTPSFQGKPLDGRTAP